MCYKGRFWFSRKERVAKKDIRVIKFAIRKNGEVRPYFQSESKLRYTENTLYTSEMGVTDHLNYIKINVGLHSYRKSLVYTKAEDVGGNLLGTSVYPIILPFVLNGYFRPINDETLVKMECRVPTGARYYCDIHGELVSDRLIVDKIIDLTPNGKTDKSLIKL